MSEKSLVVAVLCLTLALPGAARAQTGSAVERDRSFAESRTVITREQIDAQQWLTLTDLLDAQPGVFQARAGSNGQTPALFARGNQAGSVLILVDGIELADPSLTQPIAGGGATRPLTITSALAGPNPAALVTSGDFGETALPSLTLDGVERVVIRHGPQGVRYGSESVAGVIEITTRRATGRLAPWASFEAGGFGTFRSSAGFGVAGEDAGISIGFSNLTTRGISESSRKLSGRERDAFDAAELFGRGEVQLGEGLALSVAGRFSDSSTQRDFDLIAGVDSGSPVEERRRLLGRAELASTLLAGRLRTTIGVSIAEHNSEDRAKLVVPSGFALSQSSVVGDDTGDASRLTFDVTSELRLSDTHRITLGLATERESIESRLVQLTTIGLDGALLSSETRFAQHASGRTRAVFVEDELRLGPLKLELGGRIHDQEDYGTRLLYRAGASYTDAGTGLRVFGSLGTGLRDPSLSDTHRLLLSTVAIQRSLDGTAPPSSLLLQASTLLVPPDPNAEPEISRGLEIGAQLPLRDDTMRLGIAYFDSRVRGITRRIAPGSGLRSSQREKITGVEASLELRLDPAVDVQIDYTYVSSELRDLEPLLGSSGGEDVAGVPKHLAHARATWRPTEATSLFVRARYVGPRRDPTLRIDAIDGPPTIVDRKSGGYTVVDVGGSYAITEAASLYGRIENLFDRDYRDFELEQRPGFVGFIGVRLSY